VPWSISPRDAARYRGAVTYWVLKVLLSPIFYGLWRIKVEGRDHLPDRGPVILAPNHVTFLDSMFLPLVVRRRVTFVAKAEYFDSWKTAWFFRAAGQIPMRREGGSASERALAAASDVLKAGKVLGIYPEGTRSPDGRLYRGHTGVARLALGCGVPVIPVALVGTSKVQRPGSNMPRPFKRVTIRFGAPLDLARFDADAAGDPLTLRAATDELMFEIRNMSGQEYVDRYAKRHGVVGGADVGHVRTSTNGDGHGPDPGATRTPEHAGASSEPAA
jgi:1-acyl-sn-glycerol-3-phosphate acyltransferase